MACFCLMACGSGGMKNQQAVDQTVKIEKKRTFQLPEVPVMLQTPELRAKYVVEHYPQAKVLKIELTDKKGYEVELNNGFEIEFDKHMRVRDIDR